MANKNGNNGGNNHPNNSGGGGGGGNNSGGNNNNANHNNNNAGNGNGNNGGGNGGGNNNHNNAQSIGANHAAPAGNGGGSSGKEGGTGPLHSAVPVGGGGGTGNGGGTSAPVSTASWTNDYHQWLKDHPHPGHSPNAGAVNQPDGVNKWNENYHAWLQQHPNPGGNQGNHNNGGVGVGSGGVAGGNGPGGVDIGVPPGANTGGYPASSDVPTDGSTELPPPDPLGGELGGLGGLDGGLNIPGVSDQPIGSMLEQANQQPGQTIAPTEGAGGGFQVPDDILGKLPIQPGMFSHLVSPGDTMSGIAQQNGLSLADIKALNPQIPNPSMIFPGQTINLGNSGANATQAVGGITPPDTSASDFPTSSTYPPAEENAVQSRGRFGVIGRRLRGWGAGGNLPSDPARNAMYISGENNTNPLDIKDGSNPGHGQDSSNPG